jgi:hypothetical protein
MTLDGDADSAADTVSSGDKLTFGDTRTLTAIGQMTLTSTTGNIERGGSTSPTTFTSENGILINDSFSGTSNGQPLNFNADSNGSGSGTFTIVSGSVIDSTNGKLSITAADVNIAGTMTSGTKTTTIHPTKQRTIGLGLNSLNMNIETTEVQRITATGLIIGSTGTANTKSNKSIQVKGLDATVTGTITEVVTLLATVDDSQITFLTNDSTFYGLDAKADNGIFVQAQIQTTSSHLYLDGDHDNSSSNHVTFAAGQTIWAKTLLSIECRSGDQAIQRAGVLTLTAGTGILIRGDLTSTA